MTAARSPLSCVGASWVRKNVSPACSERDGNVDGVGVAAWLRRRLGWDLPENGVRLRAATTSAGHRVCADRVAPVRGAAGILIKGIADGRGRRAGHQPVGHRSAQPLAIVHPYV